MSATRYHRVFVALQQAFNNRPDLRVWRVDTQGYNVNVMTENPTLSDFRDAWRLRSPFIGRPEVFLSGCLYCLTEDSLNDIFRGEEPREGYWGLAIPILEKEGLKERFLEAARARYAMKDSSRCQIVTWEWLLEWIAQAIDQQQPPP